MPPFEVGPARAPGAIDTRLARETRGQAHKPAQAGQKHAPAMVQSDALDVRQAPVDADRVAQIRKAVEDGSYPVIPARIADAMIAAGMFLRKRA